MKIKQLVFLICLFLFAAPYVAFAQQSATITVKAFKSSQQDGTTRYEYRVINSGSNRIVGLAIGSDYYHGVSELEAVPMGWAFESTLAQDSSTSPAAWHVTVITTEESPYIELEWRNNGAADIFPGQTLAGFSIVTSQPDDHYLNGHWTAFLSDSTIECATLVLDDNPLPIDTTPPSISVVLTPDNLWPPDGKMHTITANVSAHDDQDPHPVVKLVSITCNEPLGPDDISDANFGSDSRSFSLRSTRSGKSKLGRIYTVTYSVTDASGNTATAMATVIIPHDQRN